MLFCWPRKEKTYENSSVSVRSLKQVDWLGAILLVAASTLLVFALQEAGSTAFSWNSGVIVSTLTVSGLCWIGFFAWITWLSFSNVHRLRAIFPFTIALARPVGPAIMYVAPCEWLCISADMNQSLILLTGFPYFVVVINLPQRFQVVNGDSPIMAGVHLLPLLSAMAFGEMVSAL